MSAAGQERARGEPSKITSFHGVKCIVNLY